jgi:hypothetical protein
MDLVIAVSEVQVGGNYLRASVILIYLKNCRVSVKQQPLTYTLSHCHLIYMHENSFLAIYMSKVSLTKCMISVIGDITDARK